MGGNCVGVGVETGGDGEEDLAWRNRRGRVAYEYVKASVETGGGQAATASGRESFSTGARRAPAGEASSERCEFASRAQLAAVPRSISALTGNDGGRVRVVADEDDEELERLLAMLIELAYK